MSEANNLLPEIVLADITPLPRMGRDGGPIAHQAWHAESPDRVLCGVACDWLAEWQRMKEQVRGTKRFATALESRATRRRFFD